MATIRFEGISRRFTASTSSLRPADMGRNFDDENDASGAMAALNNVHLTIPNGQTMAIVGPSGCGKSTLLRVAAGLDGEYTGNLYFDDRPMQDVPAKDRHIGMVFQNYALYPHFEGQGNLSFFFRVRKIADAEAEERIRITSEIMGIGFKQLLGRKPGTLSGGQQQRLAIGRAIVRNPQLFLFDEPLSNLDAKLRTQTRIEIKRLLRRFSITALYVTHDQTEAITLGDQIAVMRGGRVEQVGAFHELMEQPANLFVAGFLGSPPMNLLPGVVESGALHVAGEAWPLPAGLQSRVKNGQQITVGIRPDAARLVVEDEDDAAGWRLHGVAEVVEPDFANRTQLVYLRTADGHSFAARSELNVAIYGGQPVEAILPLEQLYFFDTVSEQRIVEP